MGGNVFLMDTEMEIINIHNDPFTSGLHHAEHLSHRFVHNQLENGHIPPEVGAVLMRNP